MEEDYAMANCFGAVNLYAMNSALRRGKVNELDVSLQNDIKSFDKLIERAPRLSQKTMRTDMTPLKRNALATQRTSKPPNILNKFLDLQF